MFSMFEIDFLFELNKLPKYEKIAFPNYMILLVKRIIEAGYVKWTPNKSSLVVAGIRANPDFLELTDKGIQFIKDLSQKNTGY